MKTKGKLANHNLLLSTDGVGSVLGNLFTEEEATVHSAHRIKFRGKIMSTTTASQTLNRERGVPGNANGFFFFTFKGEMLNDIRKRREIDMDRYVADTGRRSEDLPEVSMSSMRIETCKHFFGTCMNCE